MRIEAVSARAIPDTRGKPTVEATLGSGELTATASVPSGKSTGSHEALELRDAELPSRSPAAGGGVNGAVANVHGEIAALLASREWNSPDEIDAALIALDGTPNKSRLGANAILAVSIAAQRLFANAAGMPLWRAIAERAGTTPAAPRVFINMMEGGAHACPAEALAKEGRFPLPFQEYLLVIEGPTSAALATARAAFAELGTKLGAVPMGDEGGYSPTFPDLQQPFKLLAGLVAKYPGTSIAIDAAANELRNNSGGYTLLEKSYIPDELLALYRELAERFPIHSIEDPFSEDATADFARLTAAVGEKILVVGDDFTVTNPTRIEAARRADAINAVIIKPNQIGTVKEALEAVQATHSAGWQAICSHRSGETADTFIADFAYGVGAHGIKAGGFGQSERAAKYERLVVIEKETGAASGC